jgi:hypothetical protein
MTTLQGRTGTPLKTVEFECQFRGEPGQFAFGDGRVR